MNINFQFTHDTAPDNYLYGYVDETLYTAKTLEEYSFIGYGVFLTPEKEINWLPSNSNRRCNSVHKNGAYSKCNLNNNFHATDDCHDVRLQIIEEINKNACGLFIFHYIKTKAKLTYQSKKENLNKLLILLYKMQIQSNTKLYIENRNDLTQKVIEENFLILKNNILYTPPNEDPKPFINKPLHKIEVIKADKNTPGITIIDYLIWTCLRKIRNKESPYFDKFSWTNTDTFITDFGSIIPIKYQCMQRYLGNYSNNRHMRLAIYPFKSSNITINDYKEFKLLEYYLEIKRIVENIITYNPISLKHLNDEFKKYREWKLDKKYTNIVEQSCKIFLWICDTLPIWRDYDSTNICLWKKFLQLKYVALHLCKTPRKSEILDSLIWLSKNLELIKYND